MDPSLQPLALAHETIARLEVELQTLKRGVDPDPLASPISDSEHRDRIAQARVRTLDRILIASLTGLFVLVLCIVGFAIALIFVHASDSGIHPTIGPIPADAKIFGPPVSLISPSRPAPSSR